jgi:prefoldin subunit 5
MGSRSNVQTYTNRAISARTTDEKLDAIARAIDEVADFIDDLENKLNRIEQKLR